MSLDSIALIYTRLQPGVAGRGKVSRFNGFPFLRRSTWLFLLVSACALGCVPLRADAQEQEVVRIACVGDSIVYGAGVAYREKNSWPAVLGQWLGTGREVRNFGLNGATMLKKGDLPYSKQFVYHDALEYKPDILIISLGANDSKHPTAQVTNAVNNWRYKKSFVGDYKAMIAAFRKHNPTLKIFVCVPAPAYPGRWGINDTTIREEVAPLVRQVAHDTSATVIDLYTALSGKAELFPDTVHPNVAGARLIAAAVYRALTDKEAPIEKL